MRLDPPERMGYYRSGGYVETVTIAGFISTLAGVIATLIGVRLPYKQVRKTRTSVESANKAMRSTVEKIQGNAFLAENARTVKMIEQIRESVREQKIQHALLFLSEVRSSVLKLKEMKKQVPHLTQRLELKLDRIAEIEYAIERRLASGEQIAEIAHDIHKALSELADVLNAAFGTEIYNIKEEN
jgi:hypothetical protein